MSPTKEEILARLIEKWGESFKGLFLTVSRRLSKEFQILEAEGIEYQVSYDPIYKSALRTKNVVEIKFIYQDYNLFIIVDDLYPFQPPLFLIDKVCNATKDCRIRDGLEGLPIECVTEMIREFAVGVNSYTSEEKNLISPKEMAGIWIGHRKDREAAICRKPIAKKDPYAMELEGELKVEREAEAEGNPVAMGAQEGDEPEQEKLLSYMVRFTKFFHPTTTMVQCRKMMIEAFDFY
jgi:hypothetical protein